MYKITQNRTVKNWLGRTKIKAVVFEFENNTDALIFALNEQIRYYINKLLISYFAIHILNG